MWDVLCLRALLCFLGLLRTASGYGGVEPHGGKWCVFPCKNGVNNGPAQIWRQAVDVAKRLRTRRQANRLKEPFQTGVARIIRPPHQRQVIKVLRNALAQQAIDAAEAGDMQPFERLFAALQRPYDEQPEYEDLATPVPA